MLVITWVSILCVGSARRLSHISWSRTAYMLSYPKLEIAKGDASE